MDCSISEIGSDTTTDIDGDIIQRTPMILNGVKVCIFKVKDKYLQFDEVLYEGILIKAQKPFYGLSAKAAYAEKNEKHLTDLKEILLKMNF
jgi:hypothetical protein